LIISDGLQKQTHKLSTFSKVTFHVFLFPTFRPTLWFFTHIDPTRLH